MSEPFHIVERESFRVAGYCIHTTNKRKEGQKAIPRQWEELQTQGQQKELMSHMNQEPFGLFGISVYNTADDSRKFDHWIAVSSDHAVTGELEEYIVPAATWAVFPCTLDTIGKTEGQYRGLDMAGMPIEGQSRRSTGRIPINLPYMFWILS